MSKSDALFLLIKSLNKSEKRYFRMTVGFHGDQQNYLKLFEQLDKMEVYNEQLLKKQFAGEPQLKQLHVAKNYLYHQVLKSLRSYHLNSSTYIQLRSLMMDIEVLFKKDLLRQCYKTAGRAEKLARKAGDELVVLETLNWKRRVLLHMQGAINSRQEIDSLIEDEQKTLAMLKDESEFWSLTMGIGSRIPGHDTLATQHPLLEKPPRNMTHRSTVLFYHLQYVTHTMSGKLEQAGESLDKLIAYLENDLFRLKNDPSSYITAINNKIGLYLNQKKHHQVPALLERIRQLPKQLKLKANNPLSLKLLIRTYNVELETYRDIGQVEKGAALIPQVRAFLNSHSELIPLEYTILFHYQFSYLLFIQGDFGNALKDINTVLDHRYHAERVDIIGYAHFLNLIIHYELGNITVLKYSVEACRRFLKKRGSLQEFEKVLLRMFSRLSTRPHTQHRSTMEKAAEQLFSHPSLVSDLQLDYLDFRFWLKSRIRT
jgi:hypothetical protein